MADTEKEPFYETPESLEKVKLLEAEVVENAGKIQTDNKESTFRQLLHELVAFAEVHQNKISEIIDPFIKWESVATSGIFGFTVFATWFLVRFGFSVAWLIPLVSLVSSIYKSTVQRVQRKARNEAKKEFAIMEMDRDKESVEWFNSFLSRFWRNYEPGLSQGIKDTIDLTLDYYKPSGIDELRLTIFTLGSEGPRIDSIKTFANTDQETLLMDMDLSFIPVEANSMSKNEILLKDVRNVEIELLAKVGPIPFQISVREFSLAGTVY
jgi:Ca2+-dependent lipid-binding protein